jgi:hypothetical protein
MIDAHDVRCSFCRASAGETCRYPDGTDVGPEFSHTLRFLDAARAQEMQSEDDGFVFVKDWK